VPPVFFFSGDFMSAKKTMVDSFWLCELMRDINILTVSCLDRDTLAASLAAAENTIEKLRSELQEEEEFCSHLVSFIRDNMGEESVAYVLSSSVRGA